MALPWIANATLSIILLIAVHQFILFVYMIIRKPEKARLRRRYGRWAVVSGANKPLGRALSIELACNYGVNIIAVGMCDDGGENKEKTTTELTDVRDFVANVKSKRKEIYDQQVQKMNELEESDREDEAEELENANDGSVPRAKPILQKCGDVSTHTYSPSQPASQFISELDIHAKSKRGVGMLFNFNFEDDNVDFSGVVSLTNALFSEMVKNSRGLVVNMMPTVTVSSTLNENSNTAAIASFVKGWTQHLAQRCESNFKKLEQKLETNRVEFDEQQQNVVPEAADDAENEAINNSNNNSENVVSGDYLYRDPVLDVMMFHVDRVESTDSPREIDRKHVINCLEPIIHRCNEFMSDLPLYTWSLESKKGNSISASSFSAYHWLYCLRKSLRI